MTQSHKITALYSVAISLCLFPIWYNTFLPMQDYPLHLFLSHALSTFHDPAYNWSEHYKLNLHITPYSITHHLIALISRYTNVDVAGKTVISIYILLTGYIAISHNKWNSSHPEILLFPLMFSQAYYLGFMNFLLSIPLLIITLHQHISIISRKSQNKHPLLKHSATLFILFAVHPYTFTVYIVSSIFLQFTATFKRQHCTKLNPLPIVSLLALSLWLLSDISPNNITTDSSQLSLGWWLPAGSLLFYLTFLTNNAALTPTIIIPILCWSTILLVVGMVVSKNRRNLIDSEYFQLFVITTAGFFALPFVIGEYQYFNLRLAPISLFFFVLSLTTLRFSKNESLTITICSFVLIFHTIYLHHVVSIEKEDITPILEEMKPNSSVLPLYLESSSAHINNFIYYQFHTHDHNYYHIYTGGGVSPNILPNKMFPILSRDSMSLNTPLLNEFENWKQAAPMYTYLLIRHGNTHPIPELPSHFQSVIKNDKWELLINTMTHK